MKRRRNRQDDPHKTGWLARRGGMHQLAFIVTSGFSVGMAAWDIIASAMRPKRYSREKFYKTDDDGGISRFKAQTSGMSQQEIDDDARAWLRERTVYTINAFLCLAAIPALFAFGMFSIFTLIALIVLAFLLTAKAVKADFAYWQIRQGRFGPFADYLQHRLPYDMQIIRKD